MIVAERFSHSLLDYTPTLNVIWYQLTTKYIELESN